MADGMYTEEIRVSGIRVGFRVTRIRTGESGVFAHVEFRGPHRIGRYGVDLKVLEDIGVRGIMEGSDTSQVLIVDEVGPMELLSRNFVKAVENILTRIYPSILTVHYRASHPLLDRIRKVAGKRLITLNEQNRDSVPYVISQEILRTLGIPGRRMTT